jgi:hypothetical protein
MDEEYTEGEIKHAIDANAATPGVKTFIDTAYPINVTVCVPKYDGKGLPKFALNTTSGLMERQYSKLHPVIADHRQGKSYVLVHLHNDPYASAFIDSLKSVSNLYTESRPYRIALGRPYFNAAQNKFYPNALETYALEASKRVPVAYNPYAVNERTLVTVYQHKNSTFMESSISEPDMWKPADNPNLHSSLSETAAMAKFAEDNMSPSAAKKPHMYCTWYNQIDFMKSLCTDEKFGDAHTIMSSYIMPIVYTNPTDNLPDLSEWVAHDIVKLRREYDRSREGRDASNPAVCAEVMAYREGVIALAREIRVKPVGSVTTTRSNGVKSILKNVNRAGIIKKSFDKLSAMSGAPSTTMLSTHVPPHVANAEDDSYSNKRHKSKSHKHKKEKSSHKKDKHKTTTSKSTSSSSSSLTITYNNKNNNNNNITTMDIDNNEMDFIQAAASYSSPRVQSDQQDEESSGL